MDMESDVTVLSQDESAIVTEGDGISIILSKKDNDMADNHVFLVACAMRFYADADFRQEMLDWMGDCVKEAN